MVLCVYRINVNAKPERHIHFNFPLLKRIPKIARLCQQGYTRRSNISPLSVWTRPHWPPYFSNNGIFSALISLDVKPLSGNCAVPCVQRTRSHELVRWTINCTSSSACLVSATSFSKMAIVYWVNPPWAMNSEGGASEEDPEYHGDDNMEEKLII